MGEMISLVVCTLGRTEPMRRLLASLEQQTLSPHEIIVVDQNPPGFLDPVFERYKTLPVRHVRSQRGLSRGRNVGLELASGTIIGFPDDDCWYDADVLEKVDAFFASHPGTSILSGRTIDASGNESLNRYWPTSEPISRSNVFGTGNSNTIFVRNAVVAAIRGFDETLGVGARTPFQAGEESDFLLRALEQGLHGDYDRDFTIRHDQVHETLERVHAYSVGFGRVARLHKLGPSLFLTRNVRTVIGGCLRAAKGDFAGARHRYTCFVGSMRGYVAPREHDAGTLQIKGHSHGT